MKCALIFHKFHEKERKRNEQQKTTYNCLHWIQGSKFLFRALNRCVSVCIHCLALNSEQGMQIEHYLLMWIRHTYDTSTSNLSKSKLKKTKKKLNASQACVYVYLVKGHKINFNLNNNFTWKAKNSIKVKLGIDEIPWSIVTMIASHSQYICSLCC